MLISSISRTSFLSKSYYPAIVNSFLKLHTSRLLGGTHDYEVVKLPFTKERIQEIASNPSIIKKVSQATGAVVRWEQTDGTVLVEEGTEQLLLIGSSFSVRKATELLKQTVGKEEQTNTFDTDKNIQNNKLIWHGYKRNFKGQYAPAKPRRRCIRCGGKMISGNPCPLCQLQLKSDYTVNYTDTALLKQFICPHTWEILSPTITGLCREQHRLVEAAIKKSRIFGLLPFMLPFPSDEPKKHKPAGVPTDRKIKVKIN